MAKSADALRSSLVGKNVGKEDGLSVPVQPTGIAYYEHQIVIVELLEFFDGRLQ